MDLNQFLESFGKLFPQQRRDDASLSMFVQNELLQIMARTYDRKYPELDARQLIPLETNVNPGAMAWAYDSFEQRGQAQWMGGNSTNIPRVDIGKKRTSFPIHPFDVGYGWNVQEMMAAKFAGVPLSDKKAEAARRACAEFEHRVLLLGDAAVGIPGLFNNPAVPLVTVPTGNWLGGATAAQMIADVNFLIDRPWLGSKKTHTVNAIAFPNAHFRLLQTTQLPNTSMTVLQFLQATNPNVREWRACNDLDTASASGSYRILAYEKTPDSLSGVIPLAFTQLDPQIQGFDILIPCWQTIGGTVFFYPASAVYGDGA